MCSFLALQTRLWEMAMFTMCTWMLEFTEPVLNVNLNSWPFYRNPLSRRITITFHLVRLEVILQPGGIPTLRSWVCSLLFAAVSLLYSLRHLLLEVLPCCSFPQHVMPCWTPAPLQFLLARACAFTAAVLWSHAIFSFPISLPLAVGESQ